MKSSGYLKKSFEPWIPHHLHRHDKSKLLLAGTRSTSLGHY